MKTLSFEKMEKIEGGDPFISCLFLFSAANMAWSNWANDPSTQNWIAWQIAESTFYVYCIQPF
jgi:hypothetical protein